MITIDQLFTEPFIPAWMDEALRVERLRILSFVQSIQAETDFKYLTEARRINGRIMQKWAAKTSPR